MMSKQMVVSIFFLVLAVAAQQEQPASCSAEDGTCENPEELSLLQTSLKVEARKKESRTLGTKYSYVGQHKVSSALFYFKHWAKGKVAQRLSAKTLPNENATVALVEDAGAFTATATRMAQLLQAHRTLVCAPHAAHSSDVGQWAVFDSHTDEEKVQHVLLRSPNGRFQYVAEQRGSVLAADPPACPHRFPAFLQADPGSFEYESELDPPNGAPSSLALNDPAVKDCVSLLKRVAMENCKKKFRVEVIAATLNIVDGIDVHASVMLTGPKGKKNLPRATMPL
jgi:hypothetical protein